MEGIDSEEEGTTNEDDEDEVWHIDDMGQNIFHQINQFFRTA